MWLVFALLIWPSWLLNAEEETPAAHSDRKQAGVEQEFEVRPRSADEQRQLMEEALKTMAHEALADDNNTVGAKVDIATRWEKHMQGYTPELMLTFDVDAASHELFGTEVDEDPVIIRGAWFATSLSGESTAPVDVNIVDPDGATIFSSKNEDSGLFYFMGTAKGKYSIFIANTKWTQKKRVTFTVGKGISASLQSDHVQPMEDRVNSILTSLKDIQSEVTYLWMRHKSAMSQAASINSRVYWFTFLELFVLVVVSLFQVYYVKSLLTDNRKFTFY